MAAVREEVRPDGLLSGRWVNRFGSLGDNFFTAIAPQGLPDPHWVAWSPACAELLAGTPRPAPDARTLDILSGNALQPGMSPLASVYSGHQFGVWAGQLGDGRALWLGEVETPHGFFEIQLKGSGLTPYSRMGDGRAVLRSSIREFLCSEAMSALGIPTTRALCIAGSALPVHRETTETAAVVTRVASSFIRFGHFEHFTHTAPNVAALRQLADFVIDTYLPACRDAQNPYAQLLDEVARRTAELIAQWQAVGFCHGVMNTDNMSILGLTIDYGPFAFLDAFDPGYICNHSDTRGRYAYGRQPQVAFWNLHALAHALAPLTGGAEDAVAAIEAYPGTLSQALDRQMRTKLGLATAQEGDRPLIEGLLERMAADKVDFSILFRRLASFRCDAGEPNDSVRDLFIDRAAFDEWAHLYANRLRSENSGDAERRVRMNRVNPKYMLRNHLAEIAIQKAQAGEFSEIERLRAILARPFDEQPEHEAYADFPPPWAQTIEVSCSS